MRGKAFLTRQPTTVSQLIVAIVIELCLTEPAQAPEHLRSRVRLCAEQIFFHGNLRR
jgi:hypothetical protein